MTFPVQNMELQEEIEDLWKLLDTIIRNVDPDPLSQLIRLFEILIDSKAVHWKSGCVQQSSNKLLLKLDEIGILGFWLLDKNMNPRTGFSRFPRYQGELEPMLAEAIRDVVITEQIQVMQAIGEIMGACQQKLMLQS